MIKQKKEISLAERPIGIFDSGIGGLTVFKEIRKVLPHENLIYLGDTARVPYGTKSPEVIRQYSEINVRFLIEKGVKVVVVACNTASAAAIDHLKEHFPDIVVLGVIAPVVENLIKLDHVQKVGIIGTATTIRSGAYQRAIQDKIRVDILVQACPLFVPLVEEGILDHPLTMQAIDYYLAGIKKAGVDTLILGCTHYPLLVRPLDYYFNHRVRIMDSAYYTARELKKMLADGRVTNPSRDPGTESFFVTDSVDTFRHTGELFLERPLTIIEHV